MIRTALLILAPIAAVAGCTTFDRSQTRVEYRTDVTFSGHAVVTATTYGRLGMAGESRIVGYYGGGSPQFIGFGCDDATAPVIAIQEDALSHCDTVAPIDADRVRLQVRD